MSRWHPPSCQSPDVHVENELPRCRACHCHPDLEELIAQQESVGVPWTAPPDERVGEMNLHWPPCVAYKRNPEAQARFMEEAPERAMNAPDAINAREDAALPMASDPTALAISPIYERTLSANEFRLLCMSDEDGSGHLIHGTLETYQNDDCPEYETVSYAWGGENGDIRRCCPVYLGEYWDVFLQTKNCWSLLQYLQPSRGIRVIWVDAICINQSNTSERNAQVTKMGDIYRHCLRVVVYLGNDIARTARPTFAHYPAHPPRRGFHEISLNASVSTSLQNLLQFRYFSRVWVIQELLLAPSAMIPIDNIEYTIGNLTPSRLASSHPDLDWNTTDAPWVQYISQEESFPAKKLLKVLQRTWNSKAADIRDRVFGILGLIQDDTVSYGLRPDYSISPLHTYIGIFAHILLNFKRTVLLTVALGCDAPNFIPSWLPDWNSHSNLQTIDQSREQWSSIHTEKTEINKRFSSDLFEDSCKICADGRSVPKFLWDYDAFIDATSSALSIHMIHLLDFTSRPMQLQQNKDTLTGMHAISTKNCTLYIPTPAIQYGSITNQWFSDIFLLPGKDYASFLVLFMRKTDTGEAYRLVTCSQCYRLLLVKRVGTENRPVREVEGISVNIYESLHFRKKKAVPLDPNKHLTYRYPFNIYADSNRMHRKVSGNRFYRQYEFKTELAVRDILPVFQGLLNEDAGVQPDFLECYAMFFSRWSTGDSPTVADGYFEATIGCTIWPLVAIFPFQYTNDLDGYKLDLWEVPTGFSKRWGRPLIDLNINFKAELSKPIGRVRAKVARLKRWARRTEVYQTLSRLSPCRRLTGEDEVTMLLRGPKSEDHFISCWDIPQIFIDELQIDGRIRRVNIV